MAVMCANAVIGWVKRLAIEALDRPPPARDFYLNCQMKPVVIDFVGNVTLGCRRCFHRTFDSSDLLSVGRGTHVAAVTVPWTGDSVVCD